MISVVIPAYNAEPYLAEAIRSALEQTLPPLEVIVVDDGSTDATGEVARSFGDPVRYERQERRFHGAARNRGVEIALGDYFSFLDADDRYTPRKLEVQMEAFEHDPGLDAVFGHVSEFLSPEVPHELVARIRPPRIDVPWPGPNLMLVKRASFHRVGPYATEYRVGVDLDWYSRALEVGLKMLTVPAVVLERRLHPQNNGLREAAYRSHYLQVLKASLDRRREGDAQP